MQKSISKYEIKEISYRGVIMVTAIMKINKVLG
jgi:hypothetical protein